MAGRTRSTQFQIDLKGFSSASHGTDPLQVPNDRLILCHLPETCSQQHTQLDRRSDCALCCKLKRLKRKVGEVVYHSLKHLQPPFSSQTGRNAEQRSVQKAVEVESSLGTRPAESVLGCCKLGAHKLHGCS